MLRITGDVYRLLGCYTQAEEAYQQNIQYCFTDFTRLNNLLRLGLNYYYLGQVAEGKTLLQQVIEKGEAIGFGAIFLPAKVTQGIITWQTGNIESAQKEAQELEALITKRKMISTLMQIKLQLAEIAFQGENFETARGYLAGALNLSHTYANPWAAISLVRPIARINPEAFNGLSPREYLQIYLAPIETNAKMSHFWDDFRLFRDKLLTDPL